MPILVFLGLSVLDLRPMYATDRRQRDVRQKHRLMPLPIAVGHNKAPSRRRRKITCIPSCSLAGYAITTIMCCRGARASGGPLWGYYIRLAGVCVGGCAGCRCGWPCSGCRETVRVMRDTCCAAVDFVIHAEHVVHSAWILF